jgi:hypothetical protein
MRLFRELFDAENPICASLLFFHYLLDRPVVCNQRSYFVLQDVCCTMHPSAFTDTLIDLLKTIYSTKINCVS